MISIIIPALNEAKTIGRTLDRLIAENDDHEIVVVDGGSRDDTLTIVRSYPEVRCVTAFETGRGLQMNQGAAMARGEVLLFLHADTWLPPDGLAMITAAMARCGVVAGSFSLSFDAPSPFLRLYSRFSRINHILFTYGDQGLFVSRQIFERIGGFDELPLMEDVAIQKRLRRIGRFEKIPQPVVTSARRFLSHGIIRQECLNILLVCLYHIGVPADYLKRFYK